MKDSNYYQIQGWMINKLKLKGNSLLIYAMIHGFSQDGKSWFSGSLAYMAKGACCSKSTVQYSISKLMLKGFIEKKRRIEKSITYSDYKVTQSEIDKCFEGVPKIGKGGSENEYEGIPKTGTNNTNDNTNDKDNGVSPTVPRGTLTLGLEENANSERKEDARKDAFTFIEVLQHLTAKKIQWTGRGARLLENSGRKRAIDHFISKGYTLTNFRMTINHMVEKWGKDEKMKQYLTPETLFRRDNFPKYFEEMTENMQEMRKSAESSIKSAYDE